MYKPDKLYGLVHWLAIAFAQFTNVRIRDDVHEQMK
jgi:hypothetical protein